MTESTDRSLEDEARALLGAAREPLPASPEVKARALRRLMLALPPPGGGGGGDGGGGGGAPASPPIAKGLGHALATRVPAWSLLASFVAGGAAVLVATRTPPGLPASIPAPLAQSMAPALPVAPVVTAPAALSGDPAAPSIPAPVLVPPPPPPDHTARAASSIPAPRASADGLEAERSLLDVARTALVRGDGENALHAAEEHARRFPRGILAEEREAMIIQALRLLRRDDAAEARLGKFRARFPTSLMRPALEATDGGTP
jgi:hypothetical protein